AGIGTVGGNALASGSTPRKPTGPSAPPSIKSAQAAPLRHWFAHVWPAIELGRDGAVLAKREGGSPLTVSGVAQLLLMGAIRASASGDPTLSRHAAATLDPSHAAPDSTLVPGGREITFFIMFSFAALLALLIATAWAEIRSKYLYR